MEVGRLRAIELFAGLDDDRLAQLAEDGTDVAIVPGVDLFHEGEHADDWWVLVDGALDLVKHIGREDVVVGRMDTPGRWAGGFRAWDAHGVYLATGRGAVAGTLLRVPATALRQRTQEWFPFGAHLIGGLYGTARTIEATARQRDALVTLGTLAAGLAHELNNPAAAAARAVGAVAQSSAALQASLRELAAGNLSAEQFIALDGLRAQLDAATPPADPIDLSDREETLGDWLEDHAVDDAWPLASALAAAGADVDWLERSAGLLDGAPLSPGLTWAAESVALDGLLEELRESVHRISELVSSVRSYTQMDRGSVQLVRVTEGIESTLVMLGHRIRGGAVQVVRDYDADAPRIEANAGELNQVWTNLVGNALDAMESAAEPDPHTLRITTRGAPEGIVVEVADDGVGMPPEVAARAFEAFFTTKDVGKGTGLGLDIARRVVVERHGGEIEVDSSPGRTVFTVRLPAQNRR
jgi:signal transduction histidine kinase